jgi:hypothetical protein
VALRRQRQMCIRDRSYCMPMQKKTLSGYKALSRALSSVLISDGSLYAGTVIKIVLSLFSTDTPLIESLYRLYYNSVVVGFLPKINILLII